MKETLEKLVNELDGALATAVVDLSNGLVVGEHHNVPHFSSAFIDAIGAAAVDMFRGKTMTAVEAMIAATRGTELKYHFNEIQMTSDGTFHFMAVVPERPDYLLILVTRTTIHLGSGWAATRKALAEIAPLCP